MVGTASSLAVRVMELGEMTFVGLEGQLDGATAPLLTDAVRRAVAHHATTIVLDCSLLRSMGRAEAAVLADANELVRSHHGRLVMRQPNAVARAALDAVGMLDDLEIET